MKRKRENTNRKRENAREGKKEERIEDASDASRKGERKER